MRPATLVFDLDGTLVDSGRDLMATLNVMLARENLPPLALEKVNHLLGAGARALLERGFAEYGRTIEPTRLDKLFDAFLAYYSDHIANETVPFPGVREALDLLKGEDYCLAVCTNKTTDLSKKLLQELDLAKYFQTTAGRDRFIWFKPDPRHLTETIKLAGGNPAIAIMVGDSKTDIATAQNAKLPSIAVDFGYTDIPARDLGATHVISHFDELIPAIHLIEQARAWT